MKLFFSLLFVCLMICSCKEKQEEKQEANASEFERLTVEINGHIYEYDVASGATKEVKSQGEPMNYEEKLANMFWSGKPALGYIEGDYYYTDTVFDGGYVAIVDVVKKDGKVVLVELDEIAPKDYYSTDWAGIHKRLSGYGFFQAKSDRTDVSRMTLINGLTFLEYQMMSENRLTGDFKSVKGSTNSVRRAFIPAIARLASQVESPSGKFYRGVAQKADDGLIHRLQVIKEGDRIIELKYDEVFEDYPEDIKDSELKQFYRQSKYYSIDYPKVIKKDFKRFADELNEQVIQKQDLLQVSGKVVNDPAFKQELENYKKLVQQLNAQ